MNRIWSAASLEDIAAVVKGVRSHQLAYRVAGTRGVCEIELKFLVLVIYLRFFFLHQELDSDT